MTRLHLFADDKIPEDIALNISSQLAQLRPVPIKTVQYSEEEKSTFPQLFDLPKEMLLKRIEDPVKKEKKPKRKRRKPYYP